MSNAIIEHNADKHVVCRIINNCVDVFRVIIRLRSYIKYFIILLLLLELWDLHSTKKFPSDTFWYNWRRISPGLFITNERKHDFITHNLSGIFSPPI